MSSRAVPLAIRVSEQTIGEAERVCEKLDKLHRVVGTRKASRHAVLAEAIRLGIPAVEARIERQLRELGVDP